MTAAQQQLPKGLWLWLLATPQRCFQLGRKCFALCAPPASSGDLLLLWQDMLLGYVGVRNIQDAASMQSVLCWV